MSADPAPEGAQPAAEALPAMRRLLPPGADIHPAEFVEALDIPAMPAPEGRPRVLLNMASTADGRASIGGRSGVIGNRADYLLFHALRAAVDAVLIGAGTVRTERYGRIIRDAERRRRRRERGLSEEPLACIVSASLDLPADLPLLAEAAARVVILTPSQKTIGPVAASVDYVRAGRAEKCELAVALTELRERFAVRTVLCEGGPHLNHDLLRAGLLDELFLSFAPVLAGGDDPERRTLRIIAGDELAQPAPMELASVLENDSQVFLRYLVRV